jgi:hypothetical protein
MDWLSPGCLVGSTLTVAAFLADPDGAAAPLAHTARVQLVALETLGRVAVGLDAGPAPLRWLLGLRPARDVAREILGDGAAAMDREMASVVRMLPALRAARKPGPPVTTSFTEALASRVVEAIRGPDRTAPPEAIRALERLELLPNAVARARLRLVLLVLGLGGLRWFECLGFGLAVRTWLRRRTPSTRAPVARPLAPTEAYHAPRDWRHSRPPTDPIGRALVSAGVPVALAGEITGHLAAAPDWPGSLRGHDREPGGLGRHTGRVLARMAQASAAWPLEGRMAAAVVAAAHDLGKLVAYRRVGLDRWVGSGTTPHDCLSAMILARCGSWPGFASPETRTAILQALTSHHAPEGLPENASPLSRQLLAALAEADAAAALDGTSPPVGAEGTPRDAA